MADVLRFQVGGRPLEVGAAVWAQLRGPKPPEDFACDGCTLSPDVYRTWRGRTYKLWPACVVHDFHYRDTDLRWPGARTPDLAGVWPVVPGNAAGRSYADSTFRYNLRVLIALQGGSRWDQRRLSWLYWGRVRIWSARLFRHWHKGAEPLSRWARIKEVWG